MFVCLYLYVCVCVCVCVQFVFVFVIVFLLHLHYDRCALYLEFFLAVRLFTLTPAGSFHAHMEYHYSLRYRIGGSMDLPGVVGVNIVEQEDGSRTVPTGASACFVLCFYIS